MRNKIAEFFEEYKTVFLEREVKEKTTLKEYRELIQDFEKNAFEQLSLFLLTGEYVQDIEGTEKSIQRFREVITSDEVYYSQKGRGAREKSLIHLNRRIGDSLVSIQELLAILKKKLSLESSFLFYTLSIGDTEVPRGALSLFVELVLPICVQDHILVQETEYEEIKTLIRLYERVKQEGLGIYSEGVRKLLLLKYKFVIYKFLRSKEVPLNYLFNFNTRDDIDDFEKSQKGEASLLSDYITFFRVIHLDEEELDGKKKKSIERVDTVAKRAVLIKYYSSIGVEEKELNRLIDEYESKMEGEPSTLIFDYYAHKTVHNFLYNCRFSFYIKAVGKREKLLENELASLEPKLKEITALQKKTGIQNYFPYRKLLEYLVPRIEEELERIDISECVERALTFADECLKDFAYKLQWCNEHSFLPIQLPFEECRISIWEGGKKFMLFIPSGFVRPHEQEKLKLELAGMRIKLLSLRERYNTLKVITKAQIPIAEIKEQTKDLEKKILSYGATLLSILTFLITAINTLNNREAGVTFKELLFSLLGMMACLSLFIVSIYIIVSSPSGRWAKLKVIYFVVLALIAFILIFRIAIS
jgi:hypothetical protein